MVILVGVIFGEGNYETGFNSFYDDESGIKMSFIEDLAGISLLTVISENEVWIQLDTMWQEYVPGEKTQVIFQKNEESIFVSDFTVAEASMIYIEGENAKKIVQWFISEAAIRNKVDVYSIKLVADVTATLEYFNISGLEEQLKARKN